MLTLNKVNRALEQQGYTERLAKGKGYYYWTEGYAYWFRSTMVCVNSLNQLNLDAWLADLNDKLKEICVKGGF